MPGCPEAAERLLAALEHYFRRRGPMVAAYLGITGQPDVKVALRAIHLHYEGTTELPRLEDALGVLGGERLFEYLEEKLGWRLVVVDGEEHLSIPSDQYLSHVGSPGEKLGELLAEYCRSAPGIPPAGGSADSAGTL